MNAIEDSRRPLFGLACTLLLAGCAAGASLSPIPAPPTPVVTPSVAVSTLEPTPTGGPSAMDPSQQPTTTVYDASTAVDIHIQEPELECVTYPDEAGTTDYVSGVRQMRGWGRHCRYDAADPRFSGWSDIVVNSDCYLPDNSRCVRWGTERIPGPDGDWVGTFQGGALGGGVRMLFEVLEGTGAYEGWTYAVYVNQAALGGEDWVIDGLIYQGPPPLTPPLPSAATQ